MNGSLRNVARGGQSEDAGVHFGSEGAWVLLLDKLFVTTGSHINLDRNSLERVVLFGLKVDVVLQANFVPLEHILSIVARFAQVRGISVPVW